MADSRFPLLNLPDELLIEILKWLDAPDNLNAQQVSKAFNLLARHAFWESFEPRAQLLQKRFLRGLLHDQFDYSGEITWFSTCLQRIALLSRDAELQMIALATLIGLQGKQDPLQAQIWLQRLMVIGQATPDYLAELLNLVKMRLGQCTHVPIVTHQAYKNIAQAAPYIHLPALREVKLLFNLNVIPSNISEVLTSLIILLEDADLERCKACQMVLHSLLRLMPNVAPDLVSFAIEDLAGDKSFSQRSIALAIFTANPFLQDRDRERLRLVADILTRNDEDFALDLMPICPVMWKFLNAAQQQTIKDGYFQHFQYVEYREAAVDYFGLMVPCLTPGECTEQANQIVLLLLNIHEDRNLQIHCVHALAQAWGAFSLELQNQLCSTLLHGLTTPIMATKCHIAQLLAQVAPRLLINNENLLINKTMDLLDKEISKTARSSSLIELIINTLVLLWPTLGKEKEKAYAQILSCAQGEQESVVIIGMVALAKLWVHLSKEQQHQLLPLLMKNLQHKNLILRQAVTAMISSFDDGVIKKAFQELHPTACKVACDECIQFLRARPSLVNAPTLLSDAAGSTDSAAEAEPPGSAERPKSRNS